MAHEFMEQVLWNEVDHGYRAYVRISRNGKHWSKSRVGSTLEEADAFLPELRKVVLEAAYEQP